VSLPAADWILGMLSSENLSRNVNKIQKMCTEHGPGMVLKKIAHLAAKQFVQPPEKRTLLKRAVLFQTFDKEVLNYDIDQFFSSGLLRPLERIRPDIHALPYEVADTIVTEADGLLKHKFTIYGNLELGYDAKRFSWRRDPLTGFVWPRTSSATDVVRQKPVETDIKTIWEIARFQFLCPLAYAYILTSEERYARFAIDMVNFWIDENLFPCGPHWTRAMEASIRLANWCIYLPFLDILKFGELSFRNKLIESFLEHLIYIRENLENALPHGNNHYLANLVALLLGRLLFPSLEWALENAEFAAKEFEREIENQFRKSGINFEGSLPYHRLSSEICLMGVALIKKAGKQVPPRIVKRLRKAANFTRHYTGISEECPIIGDNDNGIFVKFFMGQEFNRHRYLRYLFDCILDNQNKPTSVEELLCAVHFAGTRQRIDSERSKRNKRMGSDVQVKNSDGLIIARHKSEALFLNTLHCAEGHTHNDKLAIYPVIGGKLLFLDRGSISYTGFIEKRHQDRNTASHNGPVLNGWEQNRLWISDPFYMSGDTKCGNSVKRSGNVLSITGWHDGYKRYSPGLKVFRRVTWDIRKRTMLISDWAEGKATHEDFQFTWYFLINPVWNCVMKDGTCILTSEGQSVRFKDVNGIGLTLSQGLYCPTYQVESSCPVLTASTTNRTWGQINFLLYY